MQEVNAVSGAGLVGAVLGLVNGAQSGALTTATLGGWIAGEYGTAGLGAPATSLTAAVLGYLAGGAVGGVVGAVDGFFAPGV
ncbi:hypothetical protein WS89_25435 [Burkholderia sp. MSMB1072]|nr:hypothetical protein WS89_25435 [Burkholderia sp. MSMB1072]KWO47524.1 hypothetical protein WT97_08525 [Burkholderia sp. MSMB1459WGS]